MFLGLKVKFLILDLGFFLVVEWKRFNSVLEQLVIFDCD